MNTARRYRLPPGVILKILVATNGELFEAFETARPANAIFCHQEFLEKLAEHHKDAIGKRTAFLLQRLAVDAQRLHYKTTQGENRGWRRSRLGGGQGSHFYAWWAPKNAVPLKESGEFGEAPDGALFLRDIRHHDDHSPLKPQSFDANYLPVSVQDLRREEYAPLPWTQTQVRFAAARQSVRLLKGHPGSGKTTALLHAADSCGAERVLYVTYSHNLAILAREYFDRFCSSHKSFHVVTFPDLVRQILGTDMPAVPLHESRRRFLADVTPFGRTLGMWMNMPGALYDELHAHLAGDALPVAVGRFSACKFPRVPDAAYRERRARHLGPAPIAAALDLATRLEKIDPAGSLTQRYFPQIALAWQAVERLQSSGVSGHPQPAIDAGWLNFDCIAVDECQDLTPIETFLLIELAARNNSRRNTAAPLLVSGDEAQTVRPTDFEWGWLSDLLHARLTTPFEFKLSANLRSPQRIAECVNRVWDLYSHLEKQERPSGIGLAEIEDDATDQILYCSATPGPELQELLIALASREGLAIITLDDTVPSYVPEAARAAVLTVAEAKGLDFNSVCVLDPGRVLERIVREEGRFRAGADVDGLRRRLSIDQLRVALSRPTERLFWLDVSPADSVVRQSIAFLNGRNSQHGVASGVASALLKTLEESDLDLEERVQRCQADARQYLEVKPEMAWSRAHQAITLLGSGGSFAAVADEAARLAAYLTLAEVCFTLAIRNTRLPPELGKPDLFEEAHRAAIGAKRLGLAEIISAIGQLQRALGDQRLNALVELARTIPERKAQIEPWLLVELDAKAKFWMDELELAVFNGHNAGILLRVLPPFYEALAVPDRAARTQRLQQRAIALLMKDKQFALALSILRTLADRSHKLEAACHEGLADYRSAAESHKANGNFKEALNCYRSIPDLEAALQLLAQVDDHPAAESLRWMAEIQQLVGKRPDKFTKLVTPAEKKLLEEILERSLGVTRRKPVPRKAAAKKKAPAARKRVPASLPKMKDRNPYF